MKVDRIAPAYQQVARQLRQQIISGELPLGDKLPNEGELGDLFGVSRLTVREALKALSSDGMIQTTRGVNGGSFVAAPAPDHVATRLEASVGLLSAADVLSVQDLLEARSLVEVPAARLAAARRSEADVTALQETVEVEREVSSGFDARLQLHELVVGAAGNPLLSIMSRSVHQPLRTRFLRDKAPKAFWARVRTEHIEIVEAIREQDEAGAGQAMHNHLDHLRGTYEDIDRLARNG